MSVHAYGISSFLQRGPCVLPLRTQRQKADSGAGPGARSGEGETRGLSGTLQPGPAEGSAQAWLEASGLAVSPGERRPGRRRPFRPFPTRPRCASSRGRSFPSFVALFALIGISCSVCCVSWEPIKLCFFFFLYTKCSSTGDPSISGDVSGWTGWERDTQCSRRGSEGTRVCSSLRVTAPHFCCWRWV